MLSQNDYIISEEAFRFVRDSKGQIGDVKVTEENGKNLCRAAFTKKPSFPIEFLNLYIHV